VIALCAAPFLLQHPKVGDLFPADAIQRAKQLLASFSGGIGAYQDSRGNMLVRQEVADFIKARDGFAPDPNVSAVCGRGVVRMSSGVGWLFGVVERGGRRLLGGGLCRGGVERKWSVVGWWGGSLGC